jgi:hypothetical protein
MKIQMNTRSMVAVIVVAALASYALDGPSIARGAEPANADVKNAGFEAIRALTGTWVATKPAEGQKPMTLVFRPTAGGSAIIETMFPGSEREMTNLYTVDDKGVVLTHYCMVGNQPRLRLTSVEKGVLKFEFIDAGNLKSRDEAHMDSLEMTVKGDQMTQRWSMYQDGKVTGDHSFEFKRQ